MDQIGDFKEAMSTINSLIANLVEGNIDTFIADNYGWLDTVDTERVKATAIHRFCKYQSEPTPEALKYYIEEAVNDNVNLNAYS